MTPATPVPEVVTAPTITVHWWHDELVEARGWPVLSGQMCETYWLPVLGPTSLWLLRRLAGVALAAPGTVVDVQTLGRSLGVGGTSRNSPIGRSLDRLCHFGAARQLLRRYEVRVALMPPPSHVRRRLPEQLQSALDRELAGSEAA